MSLPLKGVYKATVRAPFVGPISARFTAEPTEGGFVANSRPGVAWDMIGGVRGLLGQVFVPFLFPGGIILKWQSQSPEHGKPGDGWIQVGGIKSAGAKTRMTDPNSPIARENASPAPESSAGSSAGSTTRTNITGFVAPRDAAASSTSRSSSSSTG